MTENTENLPVSWEDQMAADAKDLMERERPALSFMSLKSGVMSIGGEPVPDNELDVIVVAVASEMVYYDTPYDSDVRAAPACYAIGDCRTEDLIPNSEVDSPVAESCVACPNFVWGSDPKGGKGRACKERRRLALLPADGSAELCILNIPGTSIKNWSNHVRTIVATTGLSPAAVVTKIKVKPHMKNQFEVLFSVVCDVPENLRGTVMAKRQVGMDAILQPYPKADEEEAPKPKSKSKRKY